MIVLFVDDRAALRRLVNVYVDGIDIREDRGLEAPLWGAEEMRLVARVQAFRDFLVTKAQRWAY